MKWIIFLLIAFLVLGCSESDKEVVINVLPFGEVPDDNYEGDYPDGSFDIKHNPWTGSIWPYDWNRVSSKIAFKEPIGYPYGFDRSTASDVSPEKDRFIYISTKNGENASFVPSLSNELFNEYQLKEETSSSIIPLLNDQITYLPAGDYTLYGYNGISWENLDKHIKVISYEPKTKDIYYVQLDGDGWDTENDKSSFTIERVTQEFNNVYRQVVMESNFIPRSPSFYNQPDVNLDLSRLLQINMVTPNNLIYNYVGKQAEDRLFAQFSGKDMKSIDIKTLSERHIVIAINKVLKYWPLKSIYENAGDLVGLTKYRFEPEREPEGTTYAIQSIGECENGVGEKGIGVTIRREISEDRKLHYYAYHDGKKVEFGPCDYLYTSNGYPVIPINNPTTLAISYSFLKKGVHFGSIIWVPRGLAPMNFYTMMHELGHSFGLADVAREDEYSSGYSSKETNLMSWQAPTGRRIRYRNQQVVYSGGRSVDDNDVEWPIENVFENQWSCLRDECDSYERWDKSNPIMKYWCYIYEEKCH